MELQHTEPFVDRFADIQILRYHVPGFEQLSLQRKKLIYFLSEAALWGRDILFDQNGKYNLAIRTVLEHIYVNYKGNRETDDFMQLEEYLKRVWFSSGIHHHYGADKFKPAFSPDFFKAEMLKISPADLHLDSNESLMELCDLLQDIIFNPEVMPKRVNQAEGEDLVLTSSCNYYEGVSQEEAEAFYGAMKSADDKTPVSYGLNSKLTKENEVLTEKVWKLNGMYGQAIQQIVQRLEMARQLAENDAQRAILESLIAFYQSGNLAEFDRYSMLWVKDSASFVDFINGFIETYGDPLGMKASWEAFVNYVDEEATRRTEIISSNAQWFEDHSPTDKAFKKEQVQGVTAKVIVAAILAGDLYPATAIGINLPNSNWIREAHGSKSVTLSNITEAYQQASADSGFSEEFVYGAEELGLVKLYGSVTDNLHTDLHECVGHGSGKLMPGVDPDGLKAYGATIEEARADLFGLYYMADEKLIEWGLLPNADAYKAAYYTYMLNGLMTQLVRIEPGNCIEEAHMRNRQLIARWVYERGAADGTLELKIIDGKTRLIIYHYPTLRVLFGELLAEIQRIKSTGDFEAARQLVETYAVNVDRNLHEEVLQRYKMLDLAPYKGFVNPVYRPVMNARGEITDILPDYTEGYVEQMLRYSTAYATLPLFNS